MEWNIKYKKKFTTATLELFKAYMLQVQTTF